MDELIKQLGEKIDLMKTETVSKAELIEIMSKVQQLETDGAEVKTLKENISFVTLI